MGLSQSVELLCNYIGNVKDFFNQFFQAIEKAKDLLQRAKPQNLNILFKKTRTTIKAKIMKQSHANKVFAHTYNVIILNILNPELQA